MDDRFRAGFIPSLLLLCLANSSCDMLGDLGLFGDNKKPVASQIKKQVEQMHQQVGEMEQIDPIENLKIRLKIRSAWGAKSA